MARTETDRIAALLDEHGIAYTVIRRLSLVEAESRWTRDNGDGTVDRGVDFSCLHNMRQAREWLGY